MALLSIPYVFTNGAVIIASQHNSNFSTIYSDYNGNIDDTNLAASANISDTKLAQITTAGKVSGAALTSLSSIPVGAGQIPAANLTNIMPSGGIILWSGTISTIPSGWYLCNGSNGTPDLRNRFIVCADADDSGVAKSTVTGSALQTSDGQLIAHTHGQQANGDDGTVAGNYSAGTNAGPSTTRSTGVTTLSTGTGTKNVAVFYALAYIMKS